MKFTTKSPQELDFISDPTEDQIKNYMDKTGENYYNARERLREESYGGTPPSGYQNWGDYWKAR